VLGGHCNGALVAFETARLLVNAGHRVDLVVMIDPVVVSVRRSARLLLLALDLTKRALGVAPDLRQHSLVLAWVRLAKIESRWRRNLARLRSKSWSEWWDTIARRTGFKETASLETGPAKPSVLETSVHPELVEAYSGAMLVYHPSRLAVPVLYIALDYSGSGWRRMSPEIELIDVIGDHFRLSGDSVAAIVGRVRARLDALDASTRVSASA
jgi:oxalate---CoA ligase